MDITQKRHDVSSLYDIYGALLTEKQQMLFTLYYHEDHSLGEISEQLQISRQAVYDTIKRVEQSLENYEEKLHFHHIYQHNQETLAKVKDKITTSGLPDQEIKTLIKLIDELRLI